MPKLFTIGAAAKFLAITTSTLRRSERSGRLLPVRTEGARRCYDPAVLRFGLHRGATVEHCNQSLIDGVTAAIKEAQCS